MSPGNLGACPDGRLIHKVERDEMKKQWVTGLLGSLSLLATFSASADAVALAAPTLQEIRAVHDGEYTVLNPRNLLMLYFAGRDGGLQNGQLSIPRITDLDKQKVDASLARYSVDSGRIGIDDDDPVRPRRQAHDAGPASYKDSFVKRAALQEVVDYFNNESAAMSNSRKLLIRTRLELSEYDFAKQQYRLEVGRGLTCSPISDSNTHITHNLCLKVPALGGMNSSPFRLLKISEAQARETIAKMTGGKAIIAECDTHNLKLNTSASAYYNQDNMQIDVGECAINRIHVVSLKSEGRSDYYQVVATFDLEGKAQRDAPVMPSKAVIAPETGLKKPAPRQQQTLDLSK